jgi:quinoprotein glucose dehydrogenase
MRRIFIGLLLAVLVLVAGLFLTGSVVWYLAGFGNDLRVEGRAERVADGAAPANGEGWQAFGGDAGGARYSAATEITRENVSQLKAAWSYQTRAFEGREAAKNRTAFEATPILVEDKLVLCTPFNDVIALDPGTGEELWRFDPGISIDSRPANQFVCRGVASWTDAQAEPGARCSRRIISATNDARILSLDLEDGKPCEGFGTGGEVQL